jgi:hypothetical protein
MLKRQWILAAAVAGALQAPALFAAQLRLSTGAEYSSGDYGEATSTEAIVVPFSARVSFGSLSLRASIPWLAVRGPANIAPIIDDHGGGDGSSSGSGSSGSGSGGSDDDDFAANRDVQGIGDATLAAAWSFSDLGGTPLYLTFTGRVRLPTGNESRGLGRGTTDYATLGEIGWDGRRGGAFLLAGRQFLEPHGTEVRRDVWQANGGLWRRIGKGSQAGVQVNWREASLAGAKDLRSVDVFLQRDLRAGWRIELSGNAGLSSASPDYGAGLGFTWRSKLP